MFKVDDNVFLQMLKIYNRNKESSDEDVKVIMEWMKKQSHLPEILDKEHIQNFLLLNKYSIEKSKQKIDMYYKIRSLLPELYENINPKHPRMKHFSDIMYWIPLPKLTKEMYRVFILKVRDKDLIDDVDPYSGASYVFNVHELRMKEDRLLGDILIFDLEDVTWSAMLKCTPSFIIKATAIYERVYSMRMKGMYMVNIHPLVDRILAVLKTVIKQKLFQRIHVYEDAKILNELFPREILPSDYGGLEKSCEELHRIVKHKFEEYEDRFDKLDSLRVDETLRPKKLENDDNLGFYGNFKKLTVD